jgi:hypothetical protein
MFSRRQRLAACALVAAAWVAGALLGVISYSPPAPRPADIPDDEFSAARAREILKDLVGDGIPHPLNSKHNKVVRERILRYFHDFAYEAEAVVGRVKWNGREWTTTNIVAHRPGSEPRVPVMLVGHYDSVPAGPGASDDGVGVAAILEIARMMRELPPTRNNVLFLITDGEEMGLLGARSFVQNDHRAADIQVAINLEARGTSGPSLMFQTSDDDAWLIPLFARHATHPMTSSLYAEVYRALPNDTDFTIFKAAGIDGYNFAFVRDVRNYHTDRDTYETADPGSLQHHGDNAWQTLRAVADFDLDRRGGGRVIYTDVLGRFVIWWPASINIVLAVSILAATILAGVIARRRGLFPVVYSRIFQAVPVVVAIALLAGLPCNRLAGFDGFFGKVSIEHGVPIFLLYWATALCAALVSFRFTLLGRVDPWSAWLGAWFWWNATGLLAGLGAPGASYLFMLPGGVAAVAGLVAALLPRRFAPGGLLVACSIGPIVAGLMWLPIQTLFYDSLGFMLPAVYPLFAGLLAMTALPLVSAAPPPKPPGTDSNLPAEKDVRIVTTPV